jgi:hypothetical protein
VPTQLPPLPKNNSGKDVLIVDDAFAREKNVSLLKNRMNESTDVYVNCGRLKRL